MNASVNLLILAYDLFFLYLEFKGEGDSGVGLLEGSTDLFSFSIVEFCSGNYSDVFFFVQDFVVFNVFINDLGEDVESLILNEGF